MSYRAGIGPRLATMIGADYTDPHVRCDGCGMVKSAYTKRGDMAAWLRNRKAPPGWRMEVMDDKRLDYCPECK